jgi:GTP-binding protein EngB required for normal cell division
LEGSEFEALKALAGASSPPLNIAVIGATGVGKSRLINAFFGIDVATVGAGRPVTMAIKAYRLPDTNVEIYDTRGLEVEQSAETVRDLERLIVDARHSPNVDDHIHIAWLCVNAASRRFEPIHESMAQMLATTKVPFVIAITKSFGSEAADLEAHVHSITWLKAPVIKLVAAPKTVGGEVVVESFGLDQLAAATAQLIGAARAAAADYGRYNADRRRVALNALQAILGRKKLMEYVGTYLAMGAYGMATMIAANGLIAEKMRRDLVASAAELQVELSQEVESYMEAMIATAVREAAIAKGQANVEGLVNNVRDIAEGDLSSLKAGLSRSLQLGKRGLNPMNTFRDVMSMARGESTLQAESPTWKYLRDITLVALSPIVEAHLSGQRILGKVDTYKRGLTALLRWTGLDRTIAPELVPVLRKAAGIGT